MLDEKSILEIAQSLVYGDRSVTHGSFADNFIRAAAIFNAWTDCEITAKGVCQVLIALKMARYMQNPEFQDNLIDLAGYTELLSRL